MDMDGQDVQDDFTKPGSQINEDFECTTDDFSSDFSIL